MQSPIIKHLKNIMSETNEVAGSADTKLMKYQLEAEKHNVAAARRERDKARDLAMECRLQWAELRQRAEVAERGLDDAELRIRNLELELDHAHSLLARHGIDSRVARSVIGRDEPRGANANNL